MERNKLLFGDEKTYANAPSVTYVMVDCGLKIVPVVGRMVQQIFDSY